MLFKVFHLLPQTMQFKNTFLCKCKSFSSSLFISLFLEIVDMQERVNILNWNYLKWGLLR